MGPGACRMTLRGTACIAGLLLGTGLADCRGHSSADVESISGVVSGPVVEGVKIDLAGPTTGATLTDGAGNYRFIDLERGSYVVTPSVAGYAFIPSAMAVELSGTAKVVNFVATQDTGCPPPGTPVCNGENRICGTVSGDVSANVKVFASLFGQTTFTAFTDSQGRYSFINL